MSLLNIGIFIIGIMVVIIMFSSKLRPPAVLYSVIVAYGLVHLAMIVEAFAAFCQAPVSIFAMPTWPSYWGHVGS